MGLVRRRAHQVDKVILCLVGSFPDRLLDVSGEFRLQDDIVVKVVLEIFSAFAASMAIIDSKDL